MSAIRVRMGLQEWISTRAMMTQRDGFFGNHAGVEQAMWVRDRLSHAFAAGRSYEEWRTQTCFVVGEHRSKSVELPVYLLERPGLSIILRNNFHNWKMSVIAERHPGILDPGDYFKHLFFTSPPVDPGYTGDPLSPCYFEGFPDDLIFGYLSQVQEREGRFCWSAELQDHHDLWMTVFMIVRGLGHGEPLQWAREKGK